MIVESMSYTEIAACYRRELVKYVAKIQEYADKFGSAIKKTRMYPLERTYSFETKDKPIIILWHTHSFGMTTGLWRTSFRRRKSISLIWNYSKI